MDENWAMSRIEKKSSNYCTKVLLHKWKIYFSILIDNDKIHKWSLPYARLRHAHSCRLPSLKSLVYSRRSRNLFFHCSDNTYHCFVSSCIPCFYGYYSEKQRSFRLCIDTSTILTMKLCFVNCLPKSFSKRTQKNKNWSKKVGNGRSGAGTKGIW